MTAGVIHPHLYSQLTQRGFFPDTATVKVNSGTTRTASGAVVATWTDLLGHVNLVGAIGDLTAAERMAPDKSIAMADCKLLLTGYYSQILTKHEIDSGGVRYRITHVLADSYELITLCYLERVTT